MVWFTWKRKLYDGKSLVLNVLHKIIRFIVSKANVTLEQGNARDIQNRRWIQTLWVRRDWKQKQIWSREKENSPDLCDSIAAVTWLQQDNNNTAFYGSEDALCEKRSQFCLLDVSALSQMFLIKTCWRNKTQKFILKSLIADCWTQFEISSRALGKTGVFFSGEKSKQQEKAASFAVGQLRFVEVLFVSYSEISETKKCHRKSKKMHFRFQPKWFWRTEIIDQKQ